MSEESTGSSSQTSTGIMIAIGCLAVGAVVLVCGGVGAAIAIPNFVAMQYKTKRAEVPTNLKRIKTSMIAYEQNFDVFVKCSAYPPTPGGKTTQMWSVGSSGGFKVINFQPDGDVRGSYMVSTSSFNFTATGIIDVDGDGVYATYVATKSENPISPITAPDIY